MKKLIALFLLSLAVSVAQDTEVGEIIVRTNAKIVSPAGLAFQDNLETFTSHTFLYQAANATKLVDSGANIVVSFRSFVSPAEVLFEAILFPGINNTYDLGFDAYRWKKAWLVDLDISGTCTGCARLPEVDTTSIVEGSVDPTKEIRFEVDGLTTATIRVLTPQDNDYILAGTNIVNDWGITQEWATDSLYDLATNTTRIRWGFADVWNAHEIEITKADKTSSFTFQYNAVNQQLDLVDTAGVNRMMHWNSATSSTTSYYDFLPGGARDLGSSGLYWTEAYIATIGRASPAFRGAAFFGVIDGNSITISGVTTATGGIATGAASNSTLYVGAGNFYNRVAGAEASFVDTSCAGVTNGWSALSSDDPPYLLVCAQTGRAFSVLLTDTDP